MNWCNVDLEWAYGDLLGSIHRQTRCIDRAYDVLHDALVRIAIVDHQEPIQQPHAYLRTVVQSVLARQGKEMARWMPFPDNDGNHDGTDHPDIIASRKILDGSVDPDRFGPTPEHLVYIRERLRALQRVLDYLAPRCRDVFWFYRVEGYTQAEIAERLGISQKTVEYHLRRTLADLALAAQELT